MTRIKRADQRGGQQQPDALQRPDVIGHQHFADPLDGERFDWRRGDGERSGVWRIAQSKPAKTARATSTPPQLNPPVVLIRAAGEQNREDDQDRDRADINKDLDQPDELRAEQKEERGDADKGDDETKRRVDELRQRGGGERAGQRENRDDDESGGAHSAKR